ncbi:MAG TPA: pyridoxamine 5'-phosphate oxidase family protein [Jatrophihabitans sp.]|nr:pyridoxamine 5'-phosphate oxidase family protein [Jatrophihabitans sp.]
MIRDQFRTLLEAPSPAVLTTYRKDGTAVASPVWFRLAADRLEVVIAENDVKLRHLVGRPECSLLVFESVPPFRGVRVDCAPTLRRDGVAEARRAIATRYLGPEGGARFTAQRGPAVVLRLPLDGARAWDLTAILPA